VSAAEISLPSGQSISQQEWETRVDLAVCYRLIALHGWDDLVSTRFLVNP